jgi:1-acyl-sn-glycerol-3-phosphate acyltransferase
MLISVMPEDDPLRARSAWAVKAFSLYLRWYFGRNFHAMRISRRAVPHVAPDRPIIICCNHPSWWDPVVFILLMHILFPDRIGFGPMDAAALQRYGVLRRMGVFGIDPETRGGAAHFLTTGARILAQQNSVLWITAEGALTDTRIRPVRLRAGVAHLARRAPQAVIVPLALEYPFWNERRPEALLHFGRPIGANAGSSVRDWTKALEAELTRTIDELAAMSVKRDPALFAQLLRGRTGIGGIYDLWRHATAMIAGRRFNPAHEADG